MRTVTVLEHAFVPIIESRTSDAPDGDLIALTNREAEQALRLNELRKGFCQRVYGGVRFSQHCGVVNLGTTVLEILPKIGWGNDDNAEIVRSRAALLTMLHRARRLTITHVGSTPQAVARAPLLDVFVEAFLLSAREQARRGLLCRYVGHRDDLTTLRGRLDVYQHLRRNATRPHLLHCVYDEFTTDNPHNRAIRCALDACRAWAYRPSTQRLLGETASQFASIVPGRMLPTEIERLLDSRERAVQRYKTVLTWSALLLRMQSPTLSAGALHAPSVLFDMNRLFESYVAHAEADCADEAYEIRVQGPQKALARCAQEFAFTLKPDVTVWERRTDRLMKIIDAKWKRLDFEANDFGVDEGDIYQLLAYAVRYGCERLELVFPAATHITRESPIFLIESANDRRIEIRIKFLPMWTGSTSAIDDLNTVAPSSADGH